MPTCTCTCTCYVQTLSVFISFACTCVPLMRGMRHAFKELFRIVVVMLHVWPYYRIVLYMAKKVSV